MMTQKTTKIATSNLTFLSCNLKHKSVKKNKGVTSMIYMQHPLVLLYNPELGLGNEIFVEA